MESNQETKLQNRRNRRSRRLQKKNSLDVQFRKRFSMLRDGQTIDNNQVDNKAILIENKKWDKFWTPRVNRKYINKKYN